MNLRDSLKSKCSGNCGQLPDFATWNAKTDLEILEKANLKEVSLQATENEDVRSLRVTTLYGLKGIAAYLHHAMVLGSYNFV